MKPWKKLSEHYVYRGWRNLIRKQFELPDGRRADFDIFGNAPFVTVVALTEDEQFILIRQYRPGPEQVLFSFPEGALDEGETPEAAANRELLEETGYQAGEIRILKELRSSYSTERQICLLATNCRRIQDQKLDQTEFIEVFTLDISAFRELVTDTSCNDLTNIDCAYLALEALGKLRII